MMFKIGTIKKFLRNFEIPERSFQVYLLELLSERNGEGVRICKRLSGGAK